jgi:hypothetical protein
MRIVLETSDRREQDRICEERAFDSRTEALQARFDAEKVHRNVDYNVEVVVVGARSRKDLKRTHGRYFLTLRELAGRTGSAVT